MTHYRRRTPDLWETVAATAAGAAAGLAAFYLARTLMSREPLERARDAPGAGGADDPPPAARDPGDAPRGDGPAEGAAG